MLRKSRAISWGYVAVLGGAFAAATLAGWTPLAQRMDGEAYDSMFSMQPPQESRTQAVVLAIDERTLTETGGMRNVRRTIAQALDRLQSANPKAVAIDLILADEGDPEQDVLLAKAIKHSGKVVLGADLLPDRSMWELPLPAFRNAAFAVGHVHAAPDPVSRVLPLELVGARERRWAMALEAFRAAKGGAITESPEGIEAGGTLIPCRRDNHRALFIRYRDTIPRVSVAELTTHPQAIERMRDRVVFLGVTAQTAAQDRLMTPLGFMMSGVEIHAQAFETLMSGRFLETAGAATVILLCLMFTIAAGAAFALLSGWAAYAVGGAVLLLAHATPHIAFGQGVILPYLTVVWAAWLTVTVAASWQHFVVRRQLHKSESDRVHYQEAIHFVTHEMRSPLTAIQGSSELMGRYNLNEEKRKQMVEMINSESKRMAKMIKTFLDIERLTDGQMEIGEELVEVEKVVQICLDRARPLAARKQIELRNELSTNDAARTALLKGDQEMIEYAVYNLLTNAVKYSPPDTVASVALEQDGKQTRISVRDQGIGMDEKELKNIFTKFYRTKKAEASGEIGTGIGLSIVDKIVRHHGGRMEVTSVPGRGSCFTMVLPTASRLTLQ
jgi:signal transduction histidine kinase